MNTVTHAIPTLSLQWNRSRDNYGHYGQLPFLDVLLVNKIVVVIYAPVLLLFFGKRLTLAY